MPDRQLVLGKLDLIRTSLRTALGCTETLRHGVETDDVDAITRGRWGLSNVIDFVQQIAAEIDREMPDWRPAHTPAVAGPDGYSGDPNACPQCLHPGGSHNVLCPVALRRLGNRQPDAHLGAVE